MSSLKKRLDLAVRELRLSGRAFEKECGLANGSYSSIRDRVGADKLDKIITRFPQLSAEWLIGGKGEMMKKTDGSVRFENSGSAYARKERIVSRVSLNREDAKTLLLQMAGIISDHQQDISRLITELEHSGRRTDRMMDIIEGGLLSGDDDQAGKQNCANSSADSIMVD